MSEENSHRPKFRNATAQAYEHELSPELRALADDFARRLAEEYEDRKRQMYDLLKRYPNEEGMHTHWTPERIEEYASGAGNTEALQEMRSKPFDHVTWQDVQSAVSQDVGKATVLMGAMSDAVKGYLDAGIFASRALGFKQPYERLEFAAIRSGFIDEWHPRGGIETSLVDMLAQTYIAWQFWLTRSFDVATNQDLASEQVAKTKSYQEPGAWNPPRVTAKEWLDHSTQMADRFNRMFLRVLRQMRDLRRYSGPVVIQNAGQVNVAADGGQQVNVQKKGKKKAHGVTSGRRLKAVK